MNGFLHPTPFSETSCTSAANAALPNDGAIVHARLATIPPCSTRLRLAEVAAELAARRLGQAGREHPGPLAAILSAMMAQTRFPSQTLKGERWSSSPGVVRGPFSSPLWSPWRSSGGSAS
jgi:hypothetical protein